MLHYHLNIISLFIIFLNLNGAHFVRDELFASLITVQASTVRRGSPLTHPEEVKEAKVAAHFADKDSDWILDLPH